MWAIIRHEAFRTLTEREAKLLIAYQTHADNDSCQCYPPLELLSGYLGTQTGNIAAARNGLERKGFLRVVEKGRRQPDGTNRATRVEIVVPDSSIRSDSAVAKRQGPGSTKKKDSSIRSNRAVRPDSSIRSDTHSSIKKKDSSIRPETPSSIRSDRVTTHLNYPNITSHLNYPESKRVGDSFFEGVEEKAGKGNKGKGKGLHDPEGKGLHDPDSGTEGKGLHDPEGKTTKDLLDQLKQFGVKYPRRHFDHVVAYFRDRFPEREHPVDEAVTHTRMLVLQLHQNRRRPPKSKTKAGQKPRSYSETGVAIWGMKNPGEVLFSADDDFKEGLHDCSDSEWDEELAKAETGRGAGSRTQGGGRSAPSAPITGCRDEEDGEDDFNDPELTQEKYEAILERQCGGTDLRPDDEPVKFTRPGDPDHRIRDEGW